MLGIKVWTADMVGERLTSVFKALPATPLYTARRNIFQPLLGSEDKGMALLAFTAECLGRESEIRVWLLTWARLRAGGESITAHCEAMGWKRATFDRVVEAAKCTVAHEINQRRDRAFRVALDLALDGIVILRARRGIDGEVIDFVCDYANEAAARGLTARTGGAETEWTLSGAFPEQMADPQFFPNYVEVLATGEGTVRDCRYDLSAKGQRWLLSTARADEERVAVTYRDITILSQIAPGMVHPMVKTPA